ncbi:hypothetical protein [Tunicatimonas pelagia]|uniref:hypothetical protein n=1 Tax=Tunicatimonas pelagia TaxID=931531 RepID=UPI0026659534|nr:hypothetical protein [Tunicatimonas pelagia]WKN46065.1 hypothetical protein P0M28_14005 [Tunicatimonas pelagia]
MKNDKEKLYVDSTLVKEGFFTDEEDYEETMDAIFRGLREASEKILLKEASRRNLPLNLPD